ncbi:hypothetical protein COOONC_13886, partial [Cooperia oncophora]
EVFSVTGGGSAPKENGEFFAGSIHFQSPVWEALEPSVLVSTTIRYGYSIPFMSSPTRPNMTDLLQSGVVREVPEPSIDNLHVHPLSVAKDIRYTRGVAREIASAQNLEWPLRRRWAKTDEEK